MLPPNPMSWHSSSVSEEFLVKGGLKALTLIECIVLLKCFRRVPRKRRIERSLQGI